MDLNICRSMDWHSLLLRGLNCARKKIPAAFQEVTLTQTHACALTEISKSQDPFRSEGLRGLNALPVSMQTCPLCGHCPIQPTWRRTPNPHQSACSQCLPERSAGIPVQAECIRCLGLADMTWDPGSGSVQNTSSGQFWTELKHVIPVLGIFGNTWRTTWKVFCLFF